MKYLLEKKKFKCCGATNFLDWTSSKYVQDSKMRAALAGKNNSYNRASESCCKTPSNLCAKRDHPSNINHNVNYHAIYIYI